MANNKGRKTEKHQLDWTRSEFLDFCEKWYERNYKIKLPKLNGYDAWLNFFKTRTPAEIKDLASNGQFFLTVEAFAALSRWHDIIKNPHKIDKIYQAGLDGQKKSKSITELARNNDRLGVLYALRDEIAEKLEKGASTRDLASLTREMGEILDQIAEVEKRNGIKKGTKLAELVGDEDFKKNEKIVKRTKGKGSRSSSITARITIDDIEEE